MSEARDNLVRNLRDLMGKSGDLSKQKWLADHSGVSIGVINKLLNKEGPDGSEPRVDIVERLANAFGFSAWQLLHPSLKVQLQEAQLYASFRQLMRDERGDK